MKMNLTGWSYGSGELKGQIAAENLHDKEVLRQIFECCAGGTPPEFVISVVVSDHEKQGIQTEDLPVLAFQVRPRK